jgi:hypothetical protein
MVLESQESSLTQRNQEGPGVVQMSLPKLIQLFPDTTSKAFAVQKAPGAIYFMLDVKPMVFEGNTDKADKIINVLKFQRDGVIVKTQFTYRYEDEFTPITMAELGEFIKEKIQYLQTNDPEALGNYEALGFQIQ